jgi:hypothetical protein
MFDPLSGAGKKTHYRPKVSQSARRPLFIPR